MVSEGTGAFNRLPARVGGFGGGGGLAAEQQRALELMAGGQSVTEAAVSVGVSRSTMYRWINDDLSFRAAYNEWQELLKESCRARLLALIDKSVNAVSKAIEAGDANLAMVLLQKMGMIREFRPGSTDPEVLRRKAEIRKRREESRLRTREMGEGIGGGPGKS